MTSLAVAMEYVSTLLICIDVLTQQHCLFVQAVFALSGSKGTVWDGDLPGIPDCDGEYGAMPPLPRARPGTPPLTVYEFEAISNYYFEAMFKYLMVAASVGALLFVSNLCLFGAVIRNRNVRTFTYQKAGSK